MADRVLHIRVVDDSGDPGRSLGSIVLRDSGEVVLRGGMQDVARSLLDRAMRQGGVSERDAFARLAGTGWSNARLMLDTSDQSQA